ncbi:MAG: hypothetical protein AAFS10_02815, partial [Myxococcota bacterium]
ANDPQWDHWLIHQSIQPTAMSLPAGTWLGSPELFEWSAEAVIIYGPQSVTHPVQTRVRVRHRNKEDLFVEFANLGELDCMANNQHLSFTYAYYICSVVGHPAKNGELELTRAPKNFTDPVTFESIFIVDTSSGEATSSFPGADIDAVWLRRFTSPTLPLDFFASELVTYQAGPHSSGSIADDPQAVLGASDIDCFTPADPNNLYALGGDTGFVEVKFSSTQGTLSPSTGDYIAVREIGLTVCGDYNPTLDDNSYQVWGKEAGTGQLYKIGDTELSTWDPNTNLWDPYQNTLSTNGIESESPYNIGRIFLIEDRDKLRPGYMFPFNGVIYFIESP